jgi:aldose 1-epimerase
MGDDMTDTLAPGVSDTDVHISGAPVQRIVLSDGTLSVAVLTLGAILQDVRLAGVSHSLTVASPDIAAYTGALRSAGALMGPVVNRISGGRARLGGTVYEFERNQDGQHTRHAGSAGTNHKLWQIGERRDDAVVLELALPDGEGGFPGNRVVAARFALPAPGTLEMTVTVTTDADSWINFANHSYWNLDGTAAYAGHHLRVAADRYCVPGPGDLVTGEVRPVADTAFDFRAGRPLAPRADPKYDVNLCLSDDRVPPREVLWLTGAGGVSMTVATTEPGLQIYDGNGLNGAGAPDHAGRPIQPYAGIAIEPQGWPDAPNQRGFPSIILRAGQAYRQITRWRFAAPAD